MLFFLFLLQNKNPVPKGDLSKLFPTGVLFITYSLLVSKSGGSNAPKQPKAKAPKKASAPRARKGRNAPLDPHNFTGEGELQAR